MSDDNVRYAIKRENGLWLKAGGKLEWIGDWSRRACFFDRRAAVEAQEDAGVACRIVRITRITRRVKEKSKKCDCGFDHSTEKDVTT